jgi:DNA-binding NarL/FixJ family response regulator
MPIRIVIADDHPVFIDGLKAMLMNAGDFEVIGSAGNGEELLKQVEILLPDLVITDIQMPVKNGVDATAEICARFPNVKVIALTMLIESSYIKKMLTAGAHGYASKTINKDELVQAIKKVAAGEKYFSSEVAQKLTNAITGKPSDNLADSLTKREKEILILISKGLTDKEIADAIFLSPLTVITHRKNILGKLGLKNKAELTRFAIENQLF